MSAPELPDLDDAVRRSTNGADEDLLEHADSSLLELVDHLLDKGAVIDAELVLGLADVDLVYVRLSALICAADKVLPARPRGEASG